MKGPRAALIVGTTAIGLLVVGFLLLNDDKAPEFPAIPSPGDQVEAAEPPATPSPSGTPRPAPRSVQKPTPAPSTTTVPVEPAQATEGERLRPVKRPRMPHDDLLEAARADPGNPMKWLDFAVVADQSDRHDLALAGLKRALHVGGDFEGRAQVERLVKDHEEAVKLGRAPSVPMSILDAGKKGSRSAY